MKGKTFYTVSIIVLTILFFLVDELFFNEKATTIQPGNKNISKEINTFYLPSSTTNSIIHHQYYSFSYNEKYEQSEWVAYELKKSHLSKKKRKRPYFEVDPLVKTGSASWRNYKNSGYDRGHFCPAGDRKFSEEAYNETFYTSNIAP